MPSLKLPVPLWLNSIHSTIIYQVLLYVPRSIPGSEDAFVSTCSPHLHRGRNCLIQPSPAGGYNGITHKVPWENLEETINLCLES
jgi:hypothetical protein